MDLRILNGIYFNGHVLSASEKSFLSRGLSVICHKSLSTRKLHTKLYFEIKFPAASIRGFSNTEGIIS